MEIKFYLLQLLLILGTTFSSLLVFEETDPPAAAEYKTFWFNTNTGDFQFYSVETSARTVLNVGGGGNSGTETPLFPANRTLLR